MLRCSIVPTVNIFRLGIFVSSAAVLIQTAGAAVANVSVVQLVRGLFCASMLMGLVMFFRPLLVGIVRALALAIRPRLTRDELAARRQLRDTRALASRG